MHASCIICADFFTYTQDISVCPCGHAFHHACLQKWIAESRTCPQCRHKVLAKNIIQKVYFDVSQHDEDVSPDMLNVLEDLKVQLMNANKEKNLIAKEKEECQNKISQLESDRKSNRKALHESEMICSVLKSQLEHQDREIAEAIEAKLRCEEMKKKLEQLQKLEKILNGSSTEAEDLLRTYGKEYSDPVYQSIAGFCTTLKKELQNSNERNTTLKKQVRELKRELISKNDELIQKNEKIELLLNDVKEAEKIKSSLEEKLETVYSEIARSALHSPLGSTLKRNDLMRILAESPMPEILKPEREQKANSKSLPLMQNSPTILSPMPLKQSQSQKEFPIKINKLPFKPPKISRIPLEVLNKTPTRSSGIKSFGYNGLGGHSKHDEFPNPKIKMLKRTHSKYSHSKNAPRTGNNTLFNYVSSDNKK